MSAILSNLASERAAEGDMEAFMDITLIIALFAKKLVLPQSSPGAAAVLSKILDKSASEPVIDPKDVGRYLFSVKQTIAETCEEEGFQPFRSAGSSGSKLSGRTGSRFANSTGTCSDFQTKSCFRGQDCSYRHSCFVCFKKFGSHRYHPAIECRQSDFPGILPFQGCEHIQPASNNKNMSSQQRSVVNPQQSHQQPSRTTSANGNGGSPGMASNTLSGNQANLIAALANALGNNPL